MAFIQIGGSKYHVVRKGEGDPLVLISGYTCQHDYWLPVADELSKHHELILVDNRGVGLTEDQGELLNAEILAEDYAKILDHLQIEKASIIGHSMGGNIAMQLAFTYPQKCKRLLLVATSPKWRKVAMMTQQAMLHLAELQIDPMLFLEVGLPWIMGDRFLSKPDQIERFIRYLAGLKRPMGMQDMKRQFNVLSSFDFENRLDQISLPTLVMYAEQDLFVFPEQSQSMVEKISGAEAIIFETGHSIPWENPEKFIAETLKFL